MKYRRLTTEELQELENEFVRFLSSQAIPRDEWEKIKVEKPDVVNDLIDIFSDMVFENILNRVEYLELKTPKDYKTFYCKADKMALLGILIEGETALDFTQEASPQHMLERLQASSATLKIYQGEKAYKHERNLELFAWLEKGAVISKDGHFYKTLEQLI